MFYPRVSGCSAQHRAGGGIIFCARRHSVAVAPLADSAGTALCVLLAAGLLSPGG